MLFSRLALRVSSLLFYSLYHILRACPVISDTKILHRGGDLLIIRRLRSMCGDKRK